MTNREAVKTILLSMSREEVSYRITIDPRMEENFLYAIGMAISALMKQEEQKAGDAHAGIDAP